MINLSFKPLRSGLAAGEANTADVLLRISPADTETPQRSRVPLNLAVVIDRSGSMSGRPLQEAKRCAEMILDRLSPDDRLAIVAYDNDADILAASGPVVYRERFRNAIGSIREGGRTNLHDGWFKGASEVARGLGQAGVARVLLLSDGCANMGQTDENIIARHCAKLAATDVSTSTYGLGSNFNEDLMTRMAQEGQGQAHYGRSAEDLIDPFQQEFDLLSALIARKLRLRLEPEDGVRVEVLNLYAADRRTGEHILPDLAVGGELWALLRLRIDADLLPDVGGPIRLLSAGLTFTDSKESRHEAGPAVLHLDILPRAAWAALPEDTFVAARAVEVMVARLAEEARLAARRGNWDRVEAIIVRMREIAVGNAWVEESLRALLVLAEARDTQGFSKEVRYKSSRMMSRMLFADEDAATWSYETEALKPNYMRKKREEGRRFDTDDARSRAVGGSGASPGAAQRRAGPHVRQSLIRNQHDWDVVKVMFPREADYEEFSKMFKLDPAALFRRTEVESDEALRNAGDGQRWSVFERMGERMSVGTFYKHARSCAVATDPETDLFLALHRGYVVLLDPPDTARTAS